MSKQVPDWRPTDAADTRVAVVTARFNREITFALLDGARIALQEADAEWEEFFVPGAYELPLAAQRLSEEYDAIVVLGAVIRGDTPHFDFVANECARGIMDVALDSGTPIAFGVLTTDTLEQARARAGGEHGNKGYDAAMTALEMAGFAK